MSDEKNSSDEDEFMLMEQQTIWNKIFLNKKNNY
jgi:hypothetical protein